MTNTMMENLGSWRRYRQTYNELSRLSIRELDDLGMAGLDLRSVARKASGL